MVENRELPLPIKLAISKGRIADTAILMSAMYGLTSGAIARILREIAEELEK